MDGYTHIVHEFDPVYDERSRVLILGTLPSVRSREAGFYYGHPRNRFWQVTAAILGSRLPTTTDEKKAMLLGGGIAVWDVIAECDIIGSSDASIKNAVPTELLRVLKAADIRAVFANGATAARLFDKYQRAEVGRDIVLLPSTSPANAAWSAERLIGAWTVIKEYLNGA